MQTASRALHDWFDGLRLPTRSSKRRTPTDNGGAEKNNEDDNEQHGDTAKLSEETVPKTASERQRLDDLSGFRIGPSAIVLTSSDSGRSGGKADVAQATLRRGKQLVAVKKHRYFQDMNKRKFAKEFIREVEVMAGLSHENIVELVGFIEDLAKGKAWIVLSWVPNGNVSEFLATGEWEIPERISLIKDTFEGVKYLHSRQPPICHGDLKSFNILVSASYRAIITDFGSARVIHCPEDEVTNDEGAQRVEANPTTDQVCTPIHIGTARNQLTLTGPAWSLRWAAPEVVNGRRPGLSSDIWAAGWVCWEVMTNKVPFPHLNSEGMITLTVIEGEVPSPREDTQLAQIVALCSMMTDCWAFDPNARPSISRCSNELGWMPSTPPSGSRMPSTDLLLQMGETHLRQSSHEKAISLFQQALSLARVADDQGDIAKALESIARGYYFQSKYNQAEEWFIQSQAVYVCLGDSQGQANTLLGLGHVYRYQSKLSQAEESYTRAQEIFALLGLSRRQADTLKGLGHTYRRCSRYTQAEECFNRAQEISTRLGDDQGRASALFGLGHTYANQLKYSEAKESYTRAQETFVRLGDDQGRANTLHRLGEVYQHQFNYIQAEESCTRALELYTGLGNDHGRANSLSQLGEVYRCQFKYNQAEELFTRAQEIYDRLGFDLNRAEMLSELGDVYRLQSKHTQAEESLTAAQEIFTLFHNLRGQADTLRHLGSLRRDLGQNVGAAAHFTQAMDLYDRLGMAEEAEDVLRQLALVLPEETSSMTSPDTSV